GAANVTVHLDQAPGASAFTATFSSTNANFSGSVGGNTLTVTAEDAVATYAGALLVSTASTTTSTAQTTLRATIQDFDDGSRGDLTHATAQFVNLDTNTLLSAVLPISNLDATNTNGTASTDATFDIGSADAQTFHI